MLHAAPAFLAKTPYSAILASASQELSPTKIRESIAALVGQNRLDEADTLSQEALLRFPQSEDILAIRALVTQVRQDWHSASATLERLIGLQGHAAPATTWYQWVRVLRCQGQTQRAMAAATQGLASHPQFAPLHEEFSALQRLGAAPALKVA